MPEFPDTPIRRSNRFNNAAFLLASSFLLAVGLLYYPKWNKPYTEATISWDVSGYYFYLPATFIYHDLRKLEFRDSILQKYIPTPEFQQGFQLETGNSVLKYPVGMAIQYLPWFAIAHVWASYSAHSADGFSKPYQLTLNLGSILVAILGLFLLKILLRRHFSDVCTGFVLLLIVLATNYLDYAAVNGAMTHSYLFTLYAGLLILTENFYRKPATATAACLGLIIGLMALTRPTEIMAVILILLWGLRFPLNVGIRQRLSLLLEHRLKVIIAILCCGAVGAIQLIYWKYVSGDFLVYSYQDQGFSWLSPHIMNGLFHYRNGWLVYTPLMGLALLGFVPLFRKHKSVFIAAFPFFLLFTYVAFAWDVWWYGGSLGQRTMVQTYPVLAFPLAALLTWIWRKGRYTQIPIVLLLLIFVYYNLWLTHQAHRGGLFHPEQMNKAYFWNVVGRFGVTDERIKLLDNPDLLKVEPRASELLLFEDFEGDSLPGGNCGQDALQGDQSLCLDRENQFSRAFTFPLQEIGDWIRVSADFVSVQKEWNIWKSAQMIVRFQDGDRIVKERMIRLHRFLEERAPENLFMEAQVPENRKADSVLVLFWNADSDKTLLIDNLKIELLYTD